VTATFTGVTASRILGVTISGLVNQVFGEYGGAITIGDEFILKPGEGVALYQEQTNGDLNVRHHFFFEWDEESNAPPAQSISFSVSTSTLYFGQASSASARFASSTNPVGDALENEAHTISVATNAVNGYTMTVKGATLTGGVEVINPIGAVNTASVVGTEQFGLRMVASGGSGTVTAPYAASGFAYAATATTSSQVASASIGDNATTTYSVRYVANIAPDTPAALYTADLIYIATANF
jgi:hypothetical protein